MKYSIVVPIYDPGDDWLRWIDAIKMQLVQPDKVQVIDSSLDDNSVVISKETGFDVNVIPKLNRGREQLFLMY